MTIEEAIEILTHLSIGLDLSSPHEHQDAVKLGIEALKRHQAAKTLPYGTIEEPLPSETE